MHSALLGRELPTSLRQDARRLEKPRSAPLTAIGQLSSAPAGLPCQAEGQPVARMYVSASGLPLLFTPSTKNVRATGWLRPSTPTRSCHLFPLVHLRSLQQLRPIVDFLAPCTRCISASASPSFPAAVLKVEYAPGAVKVLDTALHRRHVAPYETHGHHHARC